MLRKQVMVEAGGARNRGGVMTQNAQTNLSNW
jgi:hypothetical protein